MGKNQLRGFEYIKGVILDSRPFDMERDLVTATLKKKRNKLFHHYKVSRATGLLSYFSLYLAIVSTELTKKCGVMQVEIDELYRKLAVRRA